VQNNKKTKLKVAIAGFGAIGRPVAQKLDRGLKGLELAAVSARRHELAAEEILKTFSSPVPVMPVGDLAGAADVIVECAPASLFREIAEPVLTAGKTLVTVSVGALLEASDLIDIAEDNGGRILVPSGALLGLDAVQSGRPGKD
jgi:aspartate dehydrogenase